VLVFLHAWAAVSFFQNRSTAPFPPLCFPNLSDSQSAALDIRRQAFKPAAIPFQINSSINPPRGLQIASNTAGNHRNQSNLGKPHLYSAFFLEV
jgi:hypothetical protein